MIHFIQKPLKPICTTLVLFLVLWGLPKQGFSQSTNIFSTYQMTLADTSYMGNTISATISIRNVDTASYAGPIYIYFSTDTSNFSPVPLCNVQNISLGPQDTLSTTCSFTFDSLGGFNPGTNIVVVWSSGNAKLAADTLRDTIYLLQTASVQEKSQHNFFTISPSPASEFINIRMNSPESNASGTCRAKILDPFGKVLISATLTDRNRKIHVEQLPPGLYFLELELDNRKTAVQKFLRVD